VATRYRDGVFRRAAIAALSITLAGPATAGGICYYVTDGLIKEEQKRQLRVRYTFSNHTCNELPNGELIHKKSSEERIRITAHLNAGGEIKGADFGFSSEIEAEKNTREEFELTMPPTLVKCTHWARDYYNSFTVQIYQQHLKRWWLNAPTDDFGCCNIVVNCYWSSYPSIVQVRVEKFAGVDWKDNPEPTTCYDNQCPNCPGTIRYVDDEGHVPLDENPKKTSLRELKSQAPALGARAFSGVALPEGYTVADDGLRLRVGDDIVARTADGIMYRRANAEPRLISDKPLVLDDGTVISPGGLVIFSNGAVAKFSRQDDSTPTRVPKPQAPSKAN
jgi:hypothetical protein